MNDHFKCKIINFLQDCSAIAECLLGSPSLRFLRGTHTIRSQKRLIMIARALITAIRRSRNTLYVNYFYTIRKLFFITKKTVTKKIIWKKRDCKKARFARHLAN